MALTKTSGTVQVTQCNCEVMHGGRCCHVGGLLFLIRDVSLGIKPIMSVASTSKMQYWGKGSKIAKNPTKVQGADYGKKFKPDMYIKFDPRPAHLRQTTDQELYDFVKDNQRSAAQLGYQSCWDSVVKITYQDYDVTLVRKLSLVKLREAFLLSLEEQLKDLPDDPLLSTAAGKHVVSTLGQSECTEWFALRNIRITASMMLGFSKNPKNFMDKFWKISSDVPQTKPMKWGIENEMNAIQAIEKKIGSNITRCGLFISKE